jgi:hypothetical protein
LPKHFEQKVSDSILTFVNPQERNKVNRLLPIKSIKLVETDGGEEEFVDVDLLLQLYCDCFVNARN